MAPVGKVPRVLWALGAQWSPTRTWMPNSRPRASATKAGSVFSGTTGTTEARFSAPADVAAATGDIVEHGLGHLGRLGEAGAGVVQVNRLHMGSSRNNTLYFQKNNGRHNLPLYGTIFPGIFQESGIFSK